MTARVPMLLAAASGASGVAGVVRTGAGVGRFACGDSPPEVDVVLPRLSEKITTATTTSPTTDPAPRPTHSIVRSAAGAGAGRRRRLAGPFAGSATRLGSSIVW